MDALKPLDVASQTPRLTALAHGGGCGCKLAPGVLRELLEGQFAATGFDRLLVGNGNADDAAVWQLDEGEGGNPRCLVATTDFFMPIVDDPHVFGRIAATNAISDIYAMGARPLFALAVLGMPLGKIDMATVRDILAGGAQACRLAGIPVAGGHSIDSAEPIYGLAVVGEVDRDNLKTNAGGVAGDALILTKPLGVGLYSAAYRKGELDEAGMEELVTTTTLLNAVGPQLGKEPAVHALTDVTGFGLLGHTLEMARASNLRANVDWTAIPLLGRAIELARSGRVTGASGRNWASVADAVDLTGSPPTWQQDILTDPQTSGGLLVAVEPDQAGRILELVRSAGFPSAAIIGHLSAGTAGVTINSQGT